MTWSRRVRFRHSAVHQHVEGNEELRMTNDESMTNDLGLPRPVSSFELGHSFGFRHSAVRQHVEGNEELRMTNDESMTNDLEPPRPVSSFELGHSFVIRHSSFVI